MPVLYHGTSRAFATAMAASPGTIDVLTRGSGELGRGFYTQDSIANAFRRAYARWGQQGAVLVLTVDDSEYHTLTFKRMTLNSAQKLFAKLRGAKKEKTFATMHDVLEGPLVYQPQIRQQKFQTSKAQDLLNQQYTQRSVQP